MTKSPPLPKLRGERPNIKLRAYRPFIGLFNGPFGMSGKCALCKFYVVEKKSMMGGLGRGWGFRVSAKLRGKVMQHIKAEHPAELDREVERLRTAYMRFIGIGSWRSSVPYLGVPHYE